MNEIPYVDIRSSSPVELFKQHSDKTRNLINAGRDMYGVFSRTASHLLFPMGDCVSRRWLEKTGNPYREEIKSFAEILPKQGVYALNLCYSFACTSGVYKKEEGMTLARVLDWPFPAMGENIIVAHQQGQAGDFYNVTWPGLSGIFNAMAPGRFAVSLNQAPMRRYRTDVVTDWVRNRVRAYKSNALPPEHLLRKAFETAKTYDEAKTMLAREPVSLPVIYILSGLTPSEGCVIERLEDEYAIREIGSNDTVCAANHFETHLNGVGRGWLPRTNISHERAKQARYHLHAKVGDGLGWFEGPMANSLSRLAMSTDARSGKLSVMGTYGATPVTKMFNL